MDRTSESSARAHIRRESLDIYNRLHSIQADIAFVNEVRAAYPSFPLIRTASRYISFYPFCHLTSRHGQRTSAAGPGTPTLPSYIFPLLPPMTLRELSDDVICRRIRRRTRTSRAPTAITETGPSASAARTYICYPSLPPTAGTSHHHAIVTRPLMLSSGKNQSLSQTYCRRFDARRKTPPRRALQDRADLVRRHQPRHTPARRHPIAILIRHRGGRSGSGS
jgi:Rit1 N-terminal domain